jgi:6-phosphogluconolactonase
MTPQKIEITKNANSLAKRAAYYFVQLAKKAISEYGKVLAAISGGSTPRQTFLLLAQEPFKSQVNWQLVHFFWVDERCVPPEHIENNYRMASEVLLKKVPIAEEHIHRIQGELPAEEAALKYEEHLRSFFDNRIPEFHIVLLGLGVDGHTASLFPNPQTVYNHTHWVLPIRHISPPPPLVDRVTLTPMILNNAKNVFFLVSGSEKAKILADVLNSSDQPKILPAQLVKLRNGNLVWLVDRTAAEFINH